MIGAEVFTHEPCIDNYDLIIELRLHFSFEALFQLPGETGAEIT
jgi:hypothetical protein